MNVQDRVIKIGNVIFNKSLEIKMVAVNERTIAINEEFVCETPHDDSDYSYMCASDYCRCKQ